MTMNKGRFDSLPEPSGSIAIRGWDLIQKCKEIEARLGADAAREYHQKHRFDGEYSTKVEKEVSKS